MQRYLAFALALLALPLSGVHAAAPSKSDASDDRGWRQAQQPFRIYGNTYYVGSRGLSAILITSPEGDILIDGTLPQNAPMIEGHIRKLGFKLDDIKLILNSHAHSDHAGAIARLAHDSGAQVAASTKAAQTLRLGGNDPDDPQYGEAPLYPKVEQVRSVADNETVRIGPLAVQAHYTPGHTPGSTTWSWTSCEGTRCLSMVYADSLTLFSADGYRYTDPAHPERLAEFRQSLKTVAALPCDILMAPHPDVIDFLKRAGQRKRGSAPDPLIDTQACKDYAVQGRLNLEKRLAKEAAETSAH